MERDCLRPDFLVGNRGSVLERKPEQAGIFPGLSPGCRRVDRERRHPALFLGNKTPRLYERARGLADSK